MPAFEYGIAYEGRVVQDDTWACVADVMRSYHGGGYADPDHRVTGQLLRRARGTETWEHQ